MTALAVPHVVEQIGSYAGFVAVVGLAVLSALYISQARDLRRLREWAGRAPERAAEQAARAAQPIPGRTVTAQPKPQPAAKPAPAQGAAAPAQAAATAAGAATAATGAAPATATAAAGAPAPATPAGAAAKPADGDDGRPAEQKADAAGQGPGAGDASPPEVAPVSVGAGGEQKEQEQEEEKQDEPAASNGAPPETAPPPPAPQRAPRPAASLPRRPAPPRPGQTTIPPRPGGKRAGRRGPDPRYIALAVVGVLVVGAGAAIGVPKLLEEDSSPPPREARQAQSKPRAAVAPDEITVSVLNGTTVPGLAAQVGDQVENEGFVLGNVTNAAEQQRADSIVMYAPGHTRDARLVARRLRLSRDVEPVDPDSQGLAGDATVVVVVGQDQTR